ncbi:MAG: cyclic nucleotide-binding domain-containing protein, partial [Trichodesmium sp. St17_bin3_1_1]|nr:cyclic nucleotide-binding domain-containing protein [Trichodesmium sp. St17_bin3_1_1]
MVKSISTPSLTQEQLSDVLGYQLSKQEIESCLKNTENLTPKVGQFWQTADAQTGIYIITKGKVRLLDTQGELMTTLVAGASFGESTLFPGNSFFSYSARASVNLKLSY